MKTTSLRLHSRALRFEYIYEIIIKIKHNTITMAEGATRKRKAPAPITQFFKVSGEYGMI